MKRLFTLLIVLALIALFPISALAASPVFISEFNFFVTVPDGYYFLTRDKSVTGSTWDLFEESYQQQLMQLYETGNVYLNAFPEDFSHEIVLTVFEGQSYKSIYNLNDYTDAKIKRELGKEWDSTMAETGIKADAVEIYQNGDIKYFYTRGTIGSGSDTTYVMLYSTIVNGRMIQCNIRSYTGPLTSGQEDTLKQVVDSIRFLQIQSNPNKSSSSSGLGSAVTWAIVAAVAGGIGGFFNSRKKKKAANAAQGAQMPLSSPDPSAAGVPSDASSPLASPGYVCTACGAETDQLSTFCRNCGARDTLVSK